MKVRDLKVGDTIRIIGIPGEGKPDYLLLPETKRVFKKLIARGKEVRIREIDEWGAPWYACRFKTRSGGWEHHWLAVFDGDANSKGDANWVPVQHRKVKKSRRK
jgi:hypothetical protein